MSLSFIRSAWFSCFLLALTSTALAQAQSPSVASPLQDYVAQPDSVFGWKLNEIIGAQIVSVPVATPLSMAETAFRSLGVWLLGAFGGIAVVGNICVAFLLRSVG